MNIQSTPKSLRRLSTYFVDNDVAHSFQQKVRHFLGCIKISFLLLISVLCGLNGYAQEIILCPPIKGDDVVLYNDEAIEKGKFDKKHLSINPSSPLYIPITLGDVIPKGKDLIQILFVNGERRAMFFPRKIKDKDINRGVLPFAEYRKQVEFGGGYSDPQREGNPLFSWYPYDKYSKLVSYKDSVLFFVGNDDLRRSCKLRYNHPYKLIQCDFKYHHYSPELISSDRFKLLYLNFYRAFEDRSSDYGGELYVKPLGYAPHYGWGTAFTIEEVINSFVPESEFREICRTQYDQNIINSFIDEFVGNEVFVSNNFELLGANRSLDRDYWQIDSISFIRSQNTIPTPQYRYYAHVTSPYDSTLHNSFLIPVGEISGIELASTKREREHQAELLRVQQQHEQDLEDERQAVAAERELARKYGRTNARLILNGEIRLGFTKAMVEEAWGSPY